jgi:hypothetical protein
MNQNVDGKPLNYDKDAISDKGRHFPAAGRQIFFIDGVMDVLKIICSAVAGTSMMTLFSYQLSRLTHKQFREPELLSKLAERLRIDHRSPGNAIDGWMLHYAAGSLFVMLYDKLWRDNRVNEIVKNGAVLGAASGFFGAEVWRQVLKFHPNPPKVDFKNYYNQLIVAHIVFGVFARIGYQLPEKINSSTHNFVRGLSQNRN